MMKSALSLVLVVSVTTSTLPVAAQEHITSTPGPLARTITHEVARLAGESTPSAAENAAQAGRPAGESNWSRVTRLSPGSEVIVTAADVQGRRIIVAADYSDLTVLNLAGVALTAAATARLRMQAARHPEYFTTTNNAGWFVDNGGNVSRKVAPSVRPVVEVRQIVERISRTAVAEIRTATGHGSARGAVGGVAVGVAASIATTYVVALSDCRDCGWFAPVAIGFPVGFGLIGYRSGWRPAGELIYRAP